MDEVDFDSWVDPHLLVLRALAIREIGTSDADDLVQETLVRAWHRRSTFRPDRGSARGWLIAIMLDQARRRRTRTRIWPATHPTFLTSADGIFPTADRMDLEAAVRALPRRQRQVVTLFYLADLAIDDVAQALNITPGSVKRHLTDARSRLRTIVEQP